MILFAFIVFYWNGFLPIQCCACLWSGLSVPVVIVNTIFGEADLRKIRKKLDRKLTDIGQYLKREYVYLRKNFQVIRLLGNRLFEDGLVGENYIDSVLQRKKLPTHVMGIWWRFSIQYFPAPGKLFGQLSHWKIRSFGRMTGPVWPSIEYRGNGHICLDILLDV